MSNLPRLGLLTPSLAPGSSESKQHSHSIAEQSTSTTLLPVRIISVDHLPNPPTSSSPRPPTPFQRPSTDEVSNTDRSTNGSRLALRSQVVARRRPNRPLFVASDLTLRPTRLGLFVLTQNSTLFPTTSSPAFPPTLNVVRCSAFLHLPPRPRPHPRSRRRPFAARANCCIFPSIPCSVADIPPDHPSSLHLSRDEERLFRPTARRVRSLRSRAVYVLLIRARARFIHRRHTRYQSGSAALFATRLARSSIQALKRRVQSAIEPSAP